MSKLTSKTTHNEGDSLACPWGCGYQTHDLWDFDWGHPSAESGVLLTLCPGCHKPVDTRVSYTATRGGTSEAPAPSPSPVLQNCKPMHERLANYVLAWNERRFWSHVAWDKGEIYIPCTLLVFLVASPAILGAWAVDCAVVKLSRRGGP